MKKTLAIAVLALSLVPSAAMAQQRGGDAALGALSGAVVFGPVGAVAGAIVGFTAGPSIAHSLGFRRSGSARHAQKSSPRETAPVTCRRQPAPDYQAAPPPAAPLQPKTASTAPPVQGLE